MTLLRLILSWVAYGYGHLLSKMMRGSWGGALYPSYNAVMCISVAIQGNNLGELWPWKLPSTNDSNGGSSHD